MFKSIKTLLNTIPQIGRVTWIGLRDERRGNISVVESVMVTRETGLIGDRHKGGEGSKRQVTLIQSEHLNVIASVLGRSELDPILLRRNVVVAGINLLSLKDREFSVGSVLLKGTGICHPCSRMEEVLGEGAYNAVRGHGGITATVIRDGSIKIADEVFDGASM